MQYIFFWSLLEHNLSKQVCSCAQHFTINWTWIFVEFENIWISHVIFKCVLLQFHFICRNLSFKIKRPPKFDVFANPFCATHLTCWPSPLPRQWISQMEEILLSTMGQYFAFHWTRSILDIFPFCYSASSLRLLHVQAPFC